MSTRSQIKIVDSRGDEMWFYRHSDGYPAGNLPELRKFLGWLKEGRIRNNTDQAAGWLVIIGAQEYAYQQVINDEGQVDWENAEKESKQLKFLDIEPKKTCMGWKVGAYEPCVPVLHGDVEWLYEINLGTEEITITSIGGKTLKDRPELPPEDIEDLF